MNILSQDIKYLQGVGPNRALLLANELGIKTVGDLLAYYPYKYVDRSRIYKISEIDGSMPYVQLCGQIFSFETIGEGRNKRLIAHFADGTGSIDLVWFQGIKYVAKNYDCRKSYIVFGKPTVFNGHIQIAHPEIENAPEHLKEQARTTGNLFETGQLSPLTSHLSPLTSHLSTVTCQLSTVNCQLSTVNSSPSLLQHLREDEAERTQFRCDGKVDRQYVQVAQGTLGGDLTSIHRATASLDVLR